MDDTLSREEELFDAARKLDDPALRDEFIERACDGDPNLRLRLGKLLSVHNQAEELFTECISAMRSSADNLESPAAKNWARGIQEEQPGAQIGHYKIQRKIGEGGCGAVYVAEQEKPMRRLVALKVIKLGMDTRAVIARFDAERQALAMMDHPNIAKVLDAGSSYTGRPYFVMELVHGTRITDYCDQNQLDTRRRLELFVQICHAIQHAHQKGIIHRDIKPSNIIVTRHDGLPVPKVIDFGIAKATEAPLTDKTLLTMQNQFVGTPAYMSPEQAGTGGLDIDTRSDIYSLGVLLYELLTGKTPFDPKTLLRSGVDEMRRTLLEKDPPRPSALLTVQNAEDLTATALRRHAEPAKLIAGIRGDLDWIVMKALDKERARRYETANGLAMDIMRCLNNEPVVARPPSRIYRLQKLVRRNKVVFISAAAVAAALIAGLGASTWLFLKERAALQRAVTAELQQTRLTREAERARSDEARLRRQAEARERITQASVLVSQNRLDEADQIISQALPTEPSVECAALLRSLSEWHALQGQWEQSANRFGSLLQVNQLDGRDLSTLDFLGCGACLIESGRADQYDLFRQAATSRFASTTNAVAAERILKICLLTRPDKELSESLAPLARVAGESFAVTEGKDTEANFRAAWGSVSLALWEYRRGDYGRSIEWARRCLAFPEFNAPREATAHVELALALRQSGLNDEALRELTQGRQAIEAKFKGDLEVGGATEGFWFDWVFARILLQEAAK
jgi:eukaryotic-like serine/threonine-protein kinase